MTYITTQIWWWQIFITTAIIFNDLYTIFFASVWLRNNEPEASKKHNASLPRREELKRLKRELCRRFNLTDIRYSRLYCFRGCPVCCSWGHRGHWTVRNCVHVTVTEWWDQLCGADGSAAGESPTGTVSFKVWAACLTRTPRLWSTCKVNNLTERLQASCVH